MDNKNPSTFAALARDISEGSSLGRMVKDVAIAAHGQEYHYTRCIGTWREVSQMKVFASTLGLQISYYKLASEGHRVTVRWDE